MTKLKVFIFSLYIIIGYTGPSTFEDDKNNNKKGIMNNNNEKDGGEFIHSRIYEKQRLYHV